MFNIALQTEFKPNEDLERLMAIVGSMVAERIDTSADDGVTQTVGRRIGVALAGREKIINPFNLRPYRSFPEIEPVPSPFIFRVHQSGDGDLPKAALYECDNGAWRLKAMSLIKDWIALKISGIPIIE